MIARLLVAAACALAASLAAADACPAKVPEGLSATPVASRVVVTGRVMGVTQVEGRDSAATVLARTEKAWRDAGHEVKRTSAAGWEILSAKGNGCLVTLQLVQRNGAFGYLARGQDAKGGQLTAASFGLALPPGVRVSSSVASEDDGRQSLVLTMSSNQPLGQLGKQFMDALDAGAWKAGRVLQLQDPHKGLVLTLSAQKKRERVDIVMWPERGSQIVMTLSESL